MSLSPRYAGSTAGDRLVPADFSHVKGLPLLTAPKPVTIGIRWYTGCDNPHQLPDGTWHLPDVGKGESLGTVRGGHCTCLAPLGFDNTLAKQSFLERLWVFYNQLKEGACEGFGHAHSTSLEIGEVYDALQLYDNARRCEGTFPSGEGASNKGAVEALQTYGISPQQGEAECKREAGDLPYIKPVKSFAWTKDVQEIGNALGRTDGLAFPLLNSWGKEYPLIVWLPADTLARLMDEEGEADCCTD
jgi:hypothetical protein